MDELREVGIDPDLVKRDLYFRVALAEAGGLRGPAMRRIGRDHGREWNGEHPDAGYEQEYGERVRHFSANVAATSFRRAGAHALLLGEAERAREYFGRAAAAYVELDMPYGLFLEACAGGVSRRPDDVELRLWNLFARWNARREAPASEDERDDLTRPIEEPLGSQLPYLLLAAAGARNTGQLDKRALRTEAEARRTRPAGVLMLPVSVLLEVADALAARESIYQALFPVIAAYDTAVRIASANEFLWERVAMPFHPLEPDILGILMLASPLIPDLAQWIRTLPLHYRTRTLLDVALLLRP